MAFGNRITTTTQDHFLPKVVDTVLNGNVLATRMLANAKKWSGEKMKFPIKVSQNTTGTSFAGFDTFSTSASDTRVNLEYDPKFYQITVALPLDELSANSTTEKVLDLMRVELASSAHDMADDIGDLFYGDGTGNSSKDFLGLEAIVDDGTNAATIGGLTRATYSTLDSTVTAQTTLTLASMATLYNNVMSGSQKPSAIYTTEAVFALYEQLLEPKLRINKNVGLEKGGLAGGTGFTALDYKGMPVLSDEKCTANVLYMINEEYIDWYALPVAMTEPVNFTANIEGNDYSNVKGLGFSWSGWIKPTNSATVVGHIYLGGELLTTNPKRHGKLTGVTSV